MIGLYINYAGIFHTLFAFVFGCAQIPATSLEGVEEDVMSISVQSETECLEEALKTLTALKESPLDGP